MDTAARSAYDQKRPEAVLPRSPLDLVQKRSSDPLAQGNVSYVGADDLCGGLPSLDELRRNASPPQAAHADYAIALGNDELGAWPLLAQGRGDVLHVPVNLRHQRLVLGRVEQPLFNDRANRREVGVACRTNREG